MKSAVFEPRFYRHWAKDTDLISFRVVVKETDLQVYAAKDLTGAVKERIIFYRCQIEDFIHDHPEFLTSLEPVPYPLDICPPIVSDMIQAAARIGVGPMAAVAGAVAQYIGQDLLPLSPELIIENGGDIFLKSSKTRVVGLYAGKHSQFSKNLGFQISPKMTPLGICTSSGTVGHSLSFGLADAVVVLSKSVVLADAAATWLGNQVQIQEDVDKVVKMAQHVSDITGVIIIKDERIGLWGQIELVVTG